MTAATDYLAHAAALEARYRAGEHVLPGNTELITWRPEAAAGIARINELPPLTVDECKRRAA